MLVPRLHISALVDISWDSYWNLWVGQYWKNQMLAKSTSYITNMYIYLYTDTWKHIYKCKTSHLHPFPSKWLPGHFCHKASSLSALFSSFHNKCPHQIKHIKKSYICEENVCATLVMYCVCEWVSVCTLQKTIIRYLRHLPPQYFWTS